MARRREGSTARERTRAEAGPRPRRHRPSPNHPFTLLDVTMTREEYWRVRSADHVMIVEPHAPAA